MIFRERAVNAPRFFQYSAPRVFGMISDPIKMTRVRIIEVRVRYSSPQRIWACEPTPAAPMVWAKVFRVRMAARGRSMSCLNLRRLLAYFFPSVILTLMNIGVALKREASSNIGRNG